MKVIHKIVATATAAACVFAFNVVAVSSAFAATSNTATVAITVIDNDNANDPTVLRNCYVTVSADATVADALNEAGFDKVDSIEATASDPYSSYYSSYDYPYFNGKNMEAFDDDTYKYWIDLYDGEVDMNGKTAVTSTVTNGAHYQYVYDVASYDAATQSIKYSFSYGDYSGLISDPLSADVVNTCCSILPKKITKKNVDDADWFMGEIETIYAALSDAEKAKVVYDIVALRDDIIRAQDAVALGKVAKTKTVKAKANKKVTVQLKKIKSANGNKVVYFQKTKNAKVTVSKAGRITVKKGLKKNVNIKVNAYCGTTASKTITIKVKAA